MFSPHLFSHKYDIDDIIAALCGQEPAWLNTQSGQVGVTEPADAPATHRFAVEPLPAAFIAEIAASPEQSHLSEAEQAALAALLPSLTVQALPEQFEQGRLGGWLRERVKDAALEWLDTHDLIPPSMRHINRQKAARLYASTHKVRIT